MTFSGDGDVDQDELSGVALADLSVEFADSSGCYLCDKWQLMHVPQDLQPAIIAEFDSSAPQPGVAA